MMKKVTESLDNNVCIYAEIKKNNMPSIKIAEYLGMTIEKEENGIVYYIGKNVS
mgnify:CR=1 FL=1|jgi:hypothetical protein